MIGFVEKDYLDSLEYIEAIFTLGGLSECGKTSAGIYLEELPYQIKRYKIIHIEREMMEVRAYDLSEGMKDYHFIQLYSEPFCEDSFKEFVVRLVIRMKKDKVKRASIESLYRAPFGAFLKKELGQRCSNIYIDAPADVRAFRQWEKHKSEGNAMISLNDTLAKVREKDCFKESHKASDCKLIADYIVDNGANTTREIFLSEIKGIAEKTITPVCR